MNGVVRIVGRGVRVVVPWLRVRVERQDAHVPYQCENQDQEQAG